jgi:hypothetical protein
LLEKTESEQGCQMVFFQTKNPNVGKFWRALDWKTLVYFMVIWNSLRPFGIFYCHLLKLWELGIFLTVLVNCAKKNLATLNQSNISGMRHSEFGT